MNITSTYKSILFILVLGVAILLFLQIKSCETTPATFGYSQEYVDLLKIKLNYSDKLANKYKKEADSVGFLVGKKELIYIEKKENLKEVEKKLDLTDTNTVNYVNSVSEVVDACDSLKKQTTIKDSLNQKAFEQKDSSLFKANHVISLIEENNENLQKELKKKDNKIKILKFERWLYPIVGVAATILIMKQ